MECIDSGEVSEQVIHLVVRDEPGVLFLIASVFSNRGISMQGIQVQDESISHNDERCMRMIIRFSGEESRKKIIGRILSRLDYVLEST
jgi:acetolactate synthase small subunit